MLSRCAELEAKRADMEFEAMKSSIDGYQAWKAARIEREEIAKHEIFLLNLRKYDAAFAKNLDELTKIEYETEENLVSEIHETSVSKTDPRPNAKETNYEIVEGFEVLNFLDAEDIEINAADVGDDSKEFLDADVEVAADSGAGEHVMAAGDAPTYALEESAGSRTNQHFIGAGGHRMRNEGQVRLMLRAANGKKGRDIRTTFQVARVTRPLMSVSKVCDAGMTMRFTATMAVIEDANGKEVCRFIRKGGLYVATMELRNPNYKPKDRSFGRQGTN